MKKRSIPLILLTVALLYSTLSSGEQNDRKIIQVKPINLTGYKFMNYIILHYEPNKIKAINDLNYKNSSFDAHLLVLSPQFKIVAKNTKIELDYYNKDYVLLFDKAPTAVIFAIGEKYYKAEIVLQFGRENSKEFFELIKKYTDVFEQGKLGYGILDNDPELAYRLNIIKLRTGLFGKIKTDRVWRRQRRSDFVQLFELSSGLLAMEQSMQLFAGRDINSKDRLDKKTIPVASLQSPSLKQHDFKKMLGAHEVNIPPIAKIIPHDALFIRFNSIKKAIAVSDLAKLFKEHIPIFTEHIRESDDFENKLLTQFALKKPGSFIRKFYGLVIDEMAVAVHDPYLLEGADMALIFKINNKSLFDSRIKQYRADFSKKYKNTMENSVVYNGTTISLFKSPDNEIKAHSFYHNDYYVIATSEWYAKKIIDTAAGTLKPVSKNLDYHYLLKVHKGQGDAFIYIGDDFIAKIISAPFKIAELRRVNCEANLKIMQYAKNLYLLEQKESPELQDLINKKYLPQLPMCPNDGTYQLIKGKIPHCSRCGHLNFLYPLSHNSAQMVTDAEANLYKRFVDNYHRYWKNYVDPIGIALFMGKNIRIKTVILPLVENSEYKFIKTIAGGDPIKIEAVNIGTQNTIMHIGLKMRIFDNYKSDLSHIRDIKTKRELSRARTRFKHSNPQIKEDPFTCFGNEFDLFVIDKGYKEQDKMRYMQYLTRSEDKLLLSSFLARYKITNYKLALKVIPALITYIFPNRINETKHFGSYQKKLDGHVYTISTGGFFSMNLVILLRKDGLWVAIDKNSNNWVLSHIIKENGKFFQKNIKKQFDIPSNRKSNFEAGFYPENLKIFKILLHKHIARLYHDACLNNNRRLAAYMLLGDPFAWTKDDDILLKKYAGTEIKCPLGGKYAGIIQDYSAFFSCTQHYSKDKKIISAINDSEIAKFIYNLKYIISRLSFTKEGIDTKILIRNPLD